MFSTYALAQGCLADLRARLPRPVLAYGVIRRAEEAAAAHAAGADSVVIDQLDTGPKRA